MNNIKKFAEFVNESLNEGVPRADKALKDLEKQGSEIDYLDDANAATKKIWKNAGVNPDDENTIILYSYANGSWPETKKILKKHSVDFKELEDPNSAGEYFIVFVNESLNEGLHPKLKKAMKAVDKGETVYGENVRFPGRFKILELGDMLSTVDYEDGTEPMEMASMNIRIDSLQFESTEIEEGNVVITGDTNGGDPVAEVFVKE